ADDQQVQRAGRRSAALLDDALDALPALLERIADQAHAAQLSHDVQPRHVGLEVLADARQLDAAALRAEDQLDRVHRAGALAEAVADAARGRDRHGLAVPYAEHGLLRARRDAVAGADAALGIDDGVERDGLVQAVAERLQLGLFGLALEALLPPMVRQHEGEGGAQAEPEEEQRLHVHQKLVQMLARSCELVSPPPVRCRAPSEPAAPWRSGNATD